MKSVLARTGAVCLVGALATGSTLPASGAPRVGAAASSSGYTVQIITNEADCDTGLGRFRAKGTLQFIVNDQGTFYFDKKIEFKRMIGTDRFLTLDTRSYDSPRFNKGDLPTYTTLADSTRQTNFVRMYVFFTTKLRKVRKGPDGTVWKDERRLKVRAQNCDVTVS